MDAIIMFNILDAFERNLEKRLGNRKSYRKVEVLAISHLAKYDTSKQLLAGAKEGRKNEPFHNHYEEGT